MKPVVVGVIGCGNISEAYLKGALGADGIRIKACASRRLEVAQERVRQFSSLGAQACGVDELLADPEIDIVLNLTVPAAHAPVSLQILAAGKHVYLEKPLATDWDDACQMVAEAAARGLRIGCAPDTFFGAAHQASRRALDDGLIGQPVGGAAAILNHGMESWHPNPAFFYQRGGGPLLDVGPYYITQLINLLGPVASVTALASTGNPVRFTPGGDAIQVEVPTTVHGALQFANGANVSLSASWDVWQQRRDPLEIHGTEGSLLVPDPNFFGGVPLLSVRRGPWRELDIAGYAYGADNRLLRSGRMVADYRIVGLLDMAAAIREGRPHRACASLALHVLEVLNGLEQAARDGRHVAMTTSCERPAPLAAKNDEK